MNDDANAWVKKQTALAIILLLMALIPQFIILCGCCNHAARKVPTNYILLGWFTLFFSFFCCFIAA